LRLVDTELRRFGSRRAVRWLVALGLLIALVVNVVQLARSSVSASYTRGAVFGDVPATCNIGTREGLPLVELSCLGRAGSSFGIGTVREFGVGAPGQAPTPTPVIFRSVHDRKVRVGRTFEETVRGLGIAFALLGVLLGSTFLAAEFGSAGISTQLLFEPRRWWLYASKAVALFVGCGLCAVLLTVWVGIGQFGASAARGSTAGVDVGWVVERLADAGRVSAACGLASLCALGIGALARRTVVAVGIFFGLVIATGFLANVTWGKRVARLSPMNGLFATAFGKFNDAEAFIGLRTLRGAVVLALAWAIGLSLVGGWWFARREIR
jgi:hypothetical protein